MPNKNSEKPSAVKTVLIRAGLAALTGFCTAFGAAAGHTAFRKLTQKPGALVPIKGGKSGIVL